MIDSVDEKEADIEIRLNVIGVRRKACLYSIVSVFVCSDVASKYAPAADLPLWALPLVLSLAFAVIFQAWQYRELRAISDTTRVLSRVNSSRVIPALIRVYDQLPIRAVEAGLEAAIRNRNKVGLNDLEKRLLGGLLLRRSRQITRQLRTAISDVMLVPPTHLPSKMLQSDHAPNSAGRE